MASNKTNMGSFDFNEFKEQMSALKEATEKAKKEFEEKEAKGEMPKQTLGQKILGILILIVILVAIIFIFINNLDTLFLPKNSITIKVSDQNGDGIEGIKINIVSRDVNYEHDYTDVKNITILDAKPGDYTLRLENIPQEYDCRETVDNFTLKPDGKVKLEYECTKNN